MIWLLLAPSKDTAQFSSLNPLAFGSFAQYITAWKNVLSYQNGEVVLWFRNSFFYVLAILYSAVWRLVFRQVTLWQSCGFRAGL